MKTWDLRMHFGSLLSMSYSHLAPSLDPWQVLTFEALKVSAKTRPSLQLWVIRLLKQIKFHFFLALRLIIFNIIFLSLGTGSRQLASFAALSSLWDRWRQARNITSEDWCHSLGLSHLQSPGLGCCRNQDLINTIKNKCSIKVWRYLVEFWLPLDMSL